MGDYSKKLTNVPDTDFNRIRDLLADGVNLLEKKNSEYGSSWSRRGGIGAFFTIWRKVDRLEAQLDQAGFNFFDMSVGRDSTESIDETIKDLLLYLALVLEKREAIERVERQLARDADSFAINQSVNR